MVLEKYINDFPLSVSSSTELFADYSVLYRKIASVDDCVEFQDDLLSAASWCDLWKVTLKSEKCKALHVTKSNCPLVHQYVINENNLSAVDKHKHLGIWIESSLRWDAHINYIVGKANRVLGLIRRTFGSKDPVPIKTAFIALSQRKLEQIHTFLSHKNTPTQGLDSSPVQRLMSRRTKTLLPTTANLLKPKLCANVSRAFLQKLSCDIFQRRDFTYQG